MATARASARSAGLAVAALCAVVYAAPLFRPPPAALPHFDPDAGLLARLFPDVPPLWIVVRLVALAIAAVLASAPAVAADDGAPARAGPRARDRRALRIAAVVVAVLQAVAVPWAGALPPLGQAAYVVALALPALLFAAAVPATRPRPTVGDWLPTAGIVVAWIAVATVRDVGSPRVADMVDGWRGWVDTLRFVQRNGNMLTEPYVRELTAVGSYGLFLNGIPFRQAGGGTLALPTVVLLQVLWLGVAAAGVAVAATRIAGPAAASVAAAVLLFAPFTRFIAVFPTPFVLGPVVGAGLAVCALVAGRRRTDAAVAGVGALTGVAITFAPLIPTAALAVAWTGWSLRGARRVDRLAIVAALASFVAAVGPIVPKLLAAGGMPSFRLHGVVALLDSALLGQVPVAAFERARALIVWRPVEVVLGALLEPFANARTSLRVWGDAVFDPVGAVLVAVGLASCVRSIRTSAGARFVLLLFGAALAPAFVSPVDRVDAVHAAALPVPVALLAAAGFAAVAARLGVGRAAATAVAAAVAVGGVALFDVVTPRVVVASAPGIMLRAVTADAADRVVLLAYPSRWSVDVYWLFDGPITAYAGARPVGFLEYGGGPLPADGFAAEGKDLLFWSPGLETDVHVRDAVCAQWPWATLWEIRDVSGVGRVHAADIGRRGWTPAGPADRARRAGCGPPS